MELEVGQLSPTNTLDSNFLSSLFNLSSIELHERTKVVPRRGDLWINVISISPHHKMKFFFSRIYELFVVGDKTICVKTFRGAFQEFGLEVKKDYEGEWFWNFEHEVTMQYELQ